MNITFYYEFLVENEVMSNHVRSADILFKKCKIKYPDINFEKINNWSIKQEPCCKYSYSIIIIENKDNNKYFAISYTDRLESVYAQTKCWDFENCVELFSALGDHGDNFKYTPISSMTHYKGTEERISEVFDKPKIIPDRLFLRGHPYGIRVYLKDNDPRFQIEFDRVLPRVYVDEIARYSIGIDFPAAGEISTRTMDIFGIGSCLIRNKIHTRFHNEIIPNYHYADVGLDGYINCGDHNKFKEMADAYISKFEELKKNSDMVDFISKNARQYYLENCTVEAHTNILLKLLDFKKLE